MNTYTVNVSSLEVRKDVKERSKIMLIRGTIVKAVDTPSKMHNHQRWIKIVTVNEPTVCGYVQLKYLSHL